VTHLRKLMLEELQRRNYSQSTVRSYIKTLEDFAKHFMGRRISSGRTRFVLIRSIYCGRESRGCAWSVITRQRSVPSFARP
jgi:site-specific recombinase XerD